ncbi:MAG: SIMPL domain-containing protein [Chloroflexota bacterium]
MNWLNLRPVRNFAIIAAAAAALMIITIIPASAQESTATVMPSTPADPSTISVSGEGTVYAAPDIAYLEVGVQTVDADLAKSFSQTGDKIGAVLAALKALGIEDKDLQTSGVNVTPQNQYDNNGNMTGVSSYTVSNSVEVTIRKIDQVEAVANSINSLTFGIEDTSALEQQARSQAVAQAKDRAEQLATALGVTVGKPLTVAELSINNAPQPIYKATFAALASTGGGQPVSQGQLGVTVDVQITFSIG